jgi:hypothetical protein
MNRLFTSKKAFIGLSAALVVALAALAYVLWQNFWWKQSLDFVANQAGATQAMSAFRRGRLVLWEINPTNDFPRFSGRYDGPFEIWLVEYHPEMPSPWQYSQRRLNEAHNRQMRYMYEHPAKFRDSSTNILSK